MQVAERIPAWVFSGRNMGMDALIPRMGFGEMSFGTIQLGDRRRTRRLVQAADRILQHPCGTLPDKLNYPAELKGLYRLVDQDRVTHAALYLIMRKCANLSHAFFRNSSARCPCPGGEFPTLGFSRPSRRGSGPSRSLDMRPWR